MTGDSPSLSSPKNTPGTPAIRLNKTAGPSRVPALGKKTAEARPSPVGVGAADAFGRDRDDLAGLKRNFPSAPHVVPPLLVFVTFRFAHKLQGRVLALHAGDGKGRILLRRRHDQSVDHDEGGRDVGGRLGDFTACEHEVGTVVLTLILVDIDWRSDQTAAEIDPALNFELIVIVLAEKTLGEGRIGGLFRCGLGRRGERKLRPEEQSGKEQRKAYRTNKDHETSPSRNCRTPWQSTHNRDQIGAAAPRKLRRHYLGTTLAGLQVLVTLSRVKALKKRGN